MNKSDLIHHLQALLQEKVNASQLEIASTRSSFLSDTKSSAGDKHEVGRAMVQQELDKLEAQRAQLITLQEDLSRVPLERTFERVGFGSLVRTDQGVYFLAIGIGPVTMEDVTVFAISLRSPIGQSLEAKQVGDTVHFNGRTLVIQDIR